MSKKVAVFLCRFKKIVYFCSDTMSFDEQWEGGVSGKGCR